MKNVKTAALLMFSKQIFFKNFIFCTVLIIPSKTLVKFCQCLIPRNAFFSLKMLSFLRLH